MTARMDPVDVMFVIAALLGLGLLAFALRQKTRRPGPPPRRSRNLLERFWDTPEHSEAWEEDAAPPADRSREQRDGR